MSVTARFYVQQITKIASGYIAVQMMPATRGEENKAWAHYTPSGKIEMNISPDTAAGPWFESMLGKDVTITFAEREDVL